MNVSLSVIGVFLAIGTVSVQAAKPTIQATAPASLEVRVGTGTVNMPDGKSVSVRPATLSFDPPTIQTFHGLDKKGNQPAAPVNFQAYRMDWEPWPGALNLTPRMDEENTLILGSFYRHWRPETLRVKGVDGTLKTEGEDFMFDPIWGLILNRDSRLGKPKTGRIELSIEAALPRIDLIQVDPRGEVSVKKGETKLVCPDLPDADPGHVGIASIYIAPWRAANNPHYDDDREPIGGATEYAITNTEILPLGDAETISGFNVSALSKTAAKLRGGDDVRIAFMGDSIMVGAEARRWYNNQISYTAKDRTARGTLIYQLRQAYPRASIEPIPAFKGGQTTGYGVQVYDEVVAPRNADLVIIAFGANDMDSSIKGSPKNPPENFKRDIIAIVDRAQRDGSEVMLVTPLPRNPWFQNDVAERQKEYNRVLYEVAEKKNVALAPVYRAFFELPKAGVPVYNTLHNWNNHPGDLGHAIYAQTMLNTIQGVHDVR